MLDFGFYNMDCMEGMKEFPDKYFDLAIVDPPYGGGSSNDAEDTFKGAVQGRFGGNFEKYIKAERTGSWSKKYQNETDNIKHWDIAPPPEYFEELFRVSKNQIIWGGNYFSLPPTRCFVIWKKLTISENFSMAMCEYAWTSFNQNAKLFECQPQDKDRFHPTQKPVKLYDWLLSRYANRGDKILDTHCGSASSLIACHNAGLDFVGFELNPVYYEKAKKRLDAELAQMTIFDLQGNLF